MNDLIYRQAAIDAIGSYILSFTAIDRNYYEGLRDAKRLLNNLPSAESRWIPVIERLPEEDGVYLVTTSKGQVQVHVFNHNGNSEEYWMRCNKAWMPLPKPYREVIK